MAPPPILVTVAHLGFFVATGDPAETTAHLGCPGNAKLIGGNAKGVLQFQSGGHEHEFLEEAGRSFCFPFMEEELCQTGTKSILKNVEDLALKTFIAARCTSRTFHQDVENLHHFVKSSDCGEYYSLRLRRRALPRS